MENKCLVANAPGSQASAARVADWNYALVAAWTLSAVSLSWQADHEPIVISTKSANVHLLANCTASMCCTTSPAIRNAAHGPGKSASWHSQFHTAVYLAHVVFGVSQRRTGLCFSRDRTTVRYACSRIEDARDEQRFDQALDALTASLAAHALAFGLCTHISSERKDKK